MSFKNMNICIMNNETQYDKEYNNNISTHLTKKIKIDQDTDNYIIKLSKFPLEFIPENNTKRLKIFIEISLNIY